MLAITEIKNIQSLLKSKQNLQLKILDIEQNKLEYFNLNLDRKFSLNIQKLTTEQLNELNLNNKRQLLVNQKFDNLNIYNKLKLLKVNKLIPSIDLRSLFPPVYNQGYLSSCTANALCGVVAFERKGLYGSRLFLYYNERVLSNNINTDDGAYLSDGIKSLQNNGICLEKDWPYTNNFDTKPTNICYIKALKYKAKTVYNLSNKLTEMKQCLINKDPFVVGIAIYTTFQTYTVASSGYVPMPNTQTEDFLGGHAVVCVGYNDNLVRNGYSGYWIMRNSWGTTWGDRGYFYLPYAYLLDDNLATDMWCIKKI